MPQLTSAHAVGHPVLSLHGQGVLYVQLVAHLSVYFSPLLLTDVRRAFDFKDSDIKEVRRHIAHSLAAYEWDDCSNVVSR